MWRKWCGQGNLLLSRQQRKQGTREESTRGQKYPWKPGTPRSSFSHQAPASDKLIQLWTQQCKTHWMKLEPEGPLSSSKPITWQTSLQHSETLGAHFGFWPSQSTLPITVSLMLRTPPHLWTCEMIFKTISLSEKLLQCNILHNWWLQQTWWKPDELQGGNTNT